MTFSFTYVKLPLLFNVIDNPVADYVKAVIKGVFNSWIVYWHFEKGHVAKILFTLTVTYGLLSD